MLKYCISEADALATVVNLFKGAEGANVISIFDQISEGYLGVSIHTKEGEDPDLIYYPVSIEGEAKTPLTCMIATDRLEVALFIDQHPDSLVYRDLMHQRLILADMAARIYLDVPALVVGHSRSIQFAAARMLDNNNKADRSLFQAIAKQVYGIDAKPTVKPQEVPVAKNEYTENVTVVPLNDRLDFIKYFDDVFVAPEAQVVDIRYMTPRMSPEYLLVAPGMQHVAHVRANLIMRSPLVHMVLSEQISDKPITQYFDFPDGTKI